MTTQEKLFAIKAEIERHIEMHRRNNHYVAEHEFIDVLSFIENLPEEPKSVYMDNDIRKELIKLLSKMTNGIVENYTPIPLKDFVAWLEKQGEQKSKGCDISPMSIDDAIIHCKKRIDKTPCGQAHEQLANWLEELKTLKEQKPVEWSEEDEHNWSKIIEALQDKYTESYSKELVDWLNILKQKLSNVERIGKNWKPSEEQMKILSIYAHVHDGLASLYQDLNKLK